MPPVDVPATRSNSCAMREPVRRSISARTVAGMIPRMPPPSIERTFTTSAIGALLSSNVSGRAAPQSGRLRREATACGDARQGTTREAAQAGAARGGPLDAAEELVQPRDRQVVVLLVERELRRERLEEAEDPHLTPVAVVVDVVAVLDQHALDVVADEDAAEQRIGLR